MIKRIAIAHYKSYYDKQTIELATPSSKIGSGLTVVVGSNNSGKTSILDAIRILSQESPHVDNEFRHESMQLFIEAQSANTNHLRATNPDLGSTVVFSGDRQILQSQNLRYVPSRRNWKGYTANQAMDRMHYWLNLSQQGKNELDSLFVARLAKLDNNERESIKHNLKIVMPQVDDWTIDRSRGELYVKYILKNGTSHSSELFGDGLSSIFRIIVSAHDCLQTHDGTQNILLIDEPELSLHPQAQKSLCSFISNVSKDLQVIVTTHSPYFVRWSDLNNGAKIYRVSSTRVGSKISTLSPAVINKIKSLYNDWQKPNLLDPVAREVFFADKIVYFEGQEDIGLLRRFCEEKDLPALDFFGYGVGGSGNIKHFLQLAKDLNIRACAIYDGDKKPDMEEAKKLFPEFMIEALPVDDIRDKMKKDQYGKDISEVDKVGLFDSKGKMKHDYEEYIIAKIKEIDNFLCDFA